MTVGEKWNKEETKNPPSAQRRHKNLYSSPKLQKQLPLSTTVEAKNKNMGEEETTNMLHITDNNFQNGEKYQNGEVVSVFR